MHEDKGQAGIVRAKASKGKRKFTLVETTKIKVGNRKEENCYLYRAEDGTEVQFYETPTAWTFGIKTGEGKLANKLINAFCSQGVKQHDYPGGFDEAVKVLEV